MTDSISEFSGQTFRSGSVIVFTTVEVLDGHDRRKRPGEAVLLSPSESE